MAAFLVVQKALLYSHYHPSYLLLPFSSQQLLPITAPSSLPLPLPSLVSTYILHLRNSLSCSYLSWEYSLKGHLWNKDTLLNQALDWVPTLYKYILFFPWNENTSLIRRPFGSQGCSILERFCKGFVWHYKMKIKRKLVISENSLWWSPRSASGLVGGSSLEPWFWFLVTISFSLSSISGS